MKETSSEEDLKVKAVNGVMRDLRFAVSSFKDWVNIKMMAPPLGLPDSILFIDAVKETNGNGQLLKELTDKKRSKQTAIARLESIERALIPFTVQPTAGSPEEKALITLRKQYNAITSVIGSEVSIEDLRSQRDLLAEKLQNLLKREFDCVTQRNASQWSQSIDPKIGGILAGAARPYLFGTWINKTIGNVARPGPDGPEGDPLKGTGSKGTESDVFCEVPAHNGYSHGDRIRREQSNKIYPASPPGARDTNNKGDTNYLFTFRNPYGLDDGSPGYTDLPMLKAGPVYGDDTKKYDPVSIDIDCPTIFKATDVDYKHAGEENF